MNKFEDIILNCCNTILFDIFFSLILSFLANIKKPIFFTLVFSLFCRINRSFASIYKKFLTFFSIRKLLLLYF